MKKKIGLLIWMIMLIVTSSACASKDTVSSKEDSDELSFNTLKEMDEITIEESTVTVVLLQDIPLPYRWMVTGQSEGVRLVQEYEVKEAKYFSSYSVGSELEYHVFIFELEEGDSAEMEFYNIWVVEPENLSEAKDSRTFVLEYANNQWSVVAD